jgi:hypothetical protein
MRENISRQTVAHRQNPVRAHSPAREFEEEFSIVALGI